MIRFRDTIKNTIPSSLLTKWRVFRQRYLLLRQYRDHAASTDAILALRGFLWQRKTILFYPECPPIGSVEYKLCVLLGHAVTSNLNRRFDVPFKRKDHTFFDRATLNQISNDPDRIINANSIDISKRAVDEAFADVFGYTLEVDPTQHKGGIVEKSDENGTHDGRVINGPISPGDIQAGRVYQREIDNRSSKEGLIVDIRVPVHGNQLPVVYLKYRPIESRFSNNNSFVELNEPGTVFSPLELKNLRLFAKKMGVDYGELDVLRDKDERIYVVDVNNTPWGPPSGLPLIETKKALARLVKSFDQLLESRLS